MVPYICYRSTMTNTRQMSSWTCDEVASFVGTIDLGGKGEEYKQKFRDEMIDGETLKLLTMESLKGMGIPMGHAMKILQRIKSEESDQPLTPSAVELTVQQPKVESGKLTDSLSTVPVTTISETGNKSSLENSIGQENESTNNSEWSKFVGKHEYEGSDKENGIKIVVVQTRKVVRSFAGKLAMAAVGVAASAGLGAIGGDLVAGIISSCSALCSH